MAAGTLAVGAEPLCVGSTGTACRCAETGCSTCVKMDWLRQVWVAQGKASRLHDGTECFLFIQAVSLLLACQAASVDKIRAWRLWGL